MGVAFEGEQEGTSSDQVEELLDVFCYYMSNLLGFAPGFIQNRICLCGFVHHLTNLKLSQL
jgi:hypothetical protein